jgi:hypothetical protein
MKKFQEKAEQCSEIEKKERNKGGNGKWGNDYHIVKSSKKNIL